MYLTTYWTQCCKAGFCEIMMHKVTKMNISKVNIHSTIDIDVDMNMGTFLSFWYFHIEGDDSLKVYPGATRSKEEALECRIAWDQSMFA